MTIRTLPQFWPAPSRSVAEAGPPGPLLLSPSGWASFLAGGLTAFTVALVGEMPLGEFVLVAVVGWAAAVLACRGTWPGPLLASGLLRAFLAALFVTFCGYAVADAYWRSSLQDVARGWSRNLFLAIDIVAVAYLCGCARRNFAVLLVGLCAGDVASALWQGPMFGDMWKFGVGAPLTVLALLVLSRPGPVGALLAAGGMGVAHFAEDYRSFGGLCIATAGLTLVQAAPRRLRLWLAPGVAALAVAAVIGLYPQTAGDTARASRSDIERSAMIAAAAEAFEQSPFIGHGSWFSRSHVYDNFVLIRHEMAAAAHVGGFAGDNTDPGDVAIHSQILVALAEGGLFGGAFFFCYGGALVWALCDQVFVRRWHPLAPVETLVCLTGLWDLLLSPYSGAHRVAIALACGLILLQWESRRERRGKQGAAG